MIYALAAKQQLADVLAFVIDDARSETCALEHCEALRALRDDAGGSSGDAWDFLQRAVLTLEAKLRTYNGEPRVWVASIVTPEIVPREYLSDVARIALHAAATPTDRLPAPIEGVAFHLR